MDEKDKAPDAATFPSAAELAALTSAPSADGLSDPEAERRRNLPEAAKRALAEAEARRRQASEQKAAPEQGGRGGLDPARFGDWEIKGRAIDF